MDRRADSRALDVGLMEPSTRQLLDDLAREGERDSRGTFTLSLTQAYTKLARFILLDPREYVLNVVASAVASGSSSLTLESDSDDCYWEFRGGRLPQRATFENIFELLLASEQRDEDLCGRELALAILGAKNLKPSFIRVVVWQDGSGFEMRFKGEEKRFRPLTGCPWDDPQQSRILIHVHERPSLSVLGRLVGQLSGDEIPEVDLLHRRCPHSGISIFANSKKVGGPFQLGLCRRVIHLKHPQQTPPQVVWKSDEAPKEVAASDHLHGWLGCGLGGRFGQDRVLLRVHGVTFSLDPETLSQPHARGILEASHLKKDLSQASLVQDDAYRDALQQIRTLLDQFAPQTAAVDPAT